KLTWTYANRDSARAQACEASEELRVRYSLQAVGDLAKTRLLALLQHSDKHRWKEVRLESREQRMAPRVPIPADWFDADYFETGIKSNWEKGYHWHLFEGLFRRTAALLTGMIPAAKTFFDAGCAKGFLVRALRERGYEAWGCDMSRWALDKADECVRQYLKL